jgi:hypothetical protein
MVHTVPGSWACARGRLARSTGLLPMSSSTMTASRNAFLSTACILDDCPRADDAILCASELAANAAQHSRSRLPGGTFTVRATVSQDHHVRIEVQDDGGPWNQGMIDPTRHHGLDIVRAVADEWGIDGDQTSQTIWARFDWPE